VGGNSLCHQKNSGSILVQAMHYTGTVSSRSTGQRSYSVKQRVLPAYHPCCRFRDVQQDRQAC
jgi:hypothetical protein